MTAARTYPCSRCNGSGKLTVFSNVLGGTCFKCNGLGTQRHKPAAPSVKWAVFGHTRDTGNCVRLYNVTAKTEIEAISKARSTFQGANQAFRNSNTLTNARAIKFTELTNQSGITLETALAAN